MPTTTLPPGLGSALDELRATLDRAAELARQLDAKQPAETDADLKERLADVESDRRELSAKLADYEHQVGRLMNLYVATYQLHATLDPAEVQSTIAEIAINLLGAHQFVLLLRRDEEGEGYEIALLEGMYDGVLPIYDGETYRGGDPMVDQTLRDGVLRLGPTGESQALAAVPLRVQNDIVGALVVLKLLDHKPILRAEDRDLLDLLSAHAASALFAARLFATKDRKLRTLESLVKLARGE